MLAVFAVFAVFVFLVLVPMSALVLLVDWMLYRKNLSFPTRTAI